MAARLSALRTGRALPPQRSSDNHSVRGRVNRRAIVRREGFGQLKYAATSKRSEPATSCL
jgi:hypothetical protein